jgi:6-phospho-beta-glucosidase
MTTGIKLVNIGAGSLYTPDFAEVLIRFQKELPIKEWVMMDIDEERLDAVGGFTQHLLQGAGYPIKITYTSQIEEAVRDADFVFTTMRVGKAHGRVLDETIAHDHGLLGQETTGIGGLAMGLRNIPVIVRTAQAMEKYAKKDAWLINLANPAGMLTEAVVRTSHCHVVGLCNWPTMFWDGLSNIYGVPKGQIFFRFVGINHLNWAKAYLNGKELGHEARKKFIDQYMKKEIGFGESVNDLLGSDDLYEFIGWPFMPVYNRYYYTYEESVQSGGSIDKAMWASMKDSIAQKIPRVIMDKIDMSKTTTRGEMVEILDTLSVELYKEKNMDGFRLIQGTRGGKGYGEAGLNVVNAIFNNLNQVQIIDHVNEGSIKDIPFEYVVESPCLINKVGVWPLSMGEIPHHMLAYTLAAKQYEILAVEAAMSGDYHTALEAAVANPTIHSFQKAKAALDALLIAHKENLPNFRETIDKLEMGESLF